MTHRAATSAPATSDSLRDIHRASRPVVRTAHRAAELVGTPRLRGGWRAESGQGLRLVWRFDPTA